MERRKSLLKVPDRFVPGGAGGVTSARYEQVSSPCEVWADVISPGGTSRCHLLRHAPKSEMRLAAHRQTLACCYFSGRSGAIGEMTPARASQMSPRMLPSCSPICQGDYGRYFFSNIFKNDIWRGWEKVVHLWVL